MEIINRSSVNRHIRDSFQSIVFEAYFYHTYWYIKYYGPQTLKQQTSMMAWKLILVSFFRINYFHKLLSNLISPTLDSNFVANGRNHVWDFIFQKPYIFYQISIIDFETLSLYRWNKTKSYFDSHRFCSWKIKTAIDYSLYNIGPIL